MLFFKRLTLWGERVSLSGVLFREEYPLERSFVVYRLSDCVWWSFGRLVVFAFASYVCFLFSSGEGAFFPFMYKEELLWSVHCHARKRSISLEVSFSEQILLLVGEGKGAFFPFMYRRRAIYMYCHTQKQSSHLSLLFFFKFLSCS